VRLKLPRFGEIVAGAAGALLLLSLFLPWYSGGVDACIQIVDPPRPCAPTQLSAWDSLAVLDILFAIVALAGIALLALEATQRTSAVPVAWATLTALTASIAAPIALYRTLDPPGALDPRFAFLGLIACAGVAAGAWLSMRDEGIDRR